MQIEFSLLSIARWTTSQIKARTSGNRHPTWATPEEKRRVSHPKVIGGLEHDFYFSIYIYMYILGIIIPTDFQRG
jgi:hypothetical protein